MTVEQLLDFVGIRYLWSKLGPFIASEYASKEELNSVASTVGSGFDFKGSVSAVADLPSAGNQNGDMYSVTASVPDGGSYAWNGTGWVKLADAMDTSQFALDAEVVHSTGAETIGGTKTFPNPIVGSLDGTAAQAIKDGAGNVIASTYATTAVATDQRSGLMSAADKEKLDSIQCGANQYVLPQADYGTLGGVTSTSQVTDTSGLTPCPIVSGVVYYKKGGEGGGGGEGGIQTLSGEFGCADSVLTAKIDGKDGSGEVVSSVDVSPLLNYIGGRVEEVPAGDPEMLPLVDQDNPEVEPPFYYCIELNFSNSGDVIYPDGGAFSDGVLTVSFSASSPEPESFVPFFYYGDPSSKPSLLYVKLDSSTGGMPAGFPLETALAGPIVLDELDVSSGQPVPTGNTVSLVTERVDGPVLAYSFTLYSGSVEMKKVLRLHPSCDNAIDLSELVPSPSPAAVSVGLGLIDDNGTIRLAVKKATVNPHILHITEQYNTPYSYNDDEDIYEYNPSPYVIDLSNETVKLSRAWMSLLVSQKTQAQIDALKPNMKSVLTKIHWASGAVTQKTTEIPESAWRSNSCLFYINAARSEEALEYPDSRLFDTIERMECVMLKTATAYGYDIGTYFPDMQIVVNGSYWG